MKHKDFHYRHFVPEVILQCLRWYLSYPISYRNLEEMIIERGVEVDNTTYTDGCKLILWSQLRRIRLLRQALFYLMAS